MMQQIIFIAEIEASRLTAEASSVRHDEFVHHGGFSKLNETFDGKLLELLADLQDQIWPSAS